jgi:PKHD-type hydroxylase
MNLQNHWYVFQGAIPARICDDIIAYGEQQSEETALTGDYDGAVPTDQKDVSKLYKTRNSSIVWMNDQWIYREVQPYIHQANKEAGWNFDWHHSESCQFTKYRESQHYDWHQDSWNKPYNKPREFTDGLIRKLSVTVSLADGGEYEGGDLEFNLRNKNEDTSVIQRSKEARVKGSVIVFPSFVWHRVAPVTKGTRYSLVIWNLGFPFK